MPIQEQAAAELADVIALRRAIHEDPELGLDNPRTRDRVRDALTPLGLEVREGSGEASWLTADLRGGDGPTVLLRADTDALPMTEDTDLPFRSRTEEAAHACGHDAHTAMLVGAARVLAERRDEIGGTVRFAFQPGEEGFGGARHMIDEGVLEGVDSAYAIHITPNIPSGFAASRAGAFMASADEIHIDVVGAGGHASTPHFCTDPITVAAHIVTSLQTMVTRELNAFDPAVLTIAKITAGTTTNVIPERAHLSGTLRTVSDATQLHVHESIQRVAAGVAAAHGATVEVRIDVGYPVTVNHAASIELVAGATRDALGPDRFFELPTPVMGAEDFSYVLQQVPGAMTLLGVCPDDISDSLSAPPCHSNRMRLHEPALAGGVALHVATALRAMSGAS